MIYPLAGNWIWGGGWLANLGRNLGLGHGYVDAARGRAGASARRGGRAGRHPGLSSRGGPDQPHRTRRPLPATRWPLLALLGAVALLVGSFAWTVANPSCPGTR